MAKVEVLIDKTEKEELAEVKEFAETLSKEKQIELIGFFNGLRFALR